MAVRGGNQTSPALPDPANLSNFLNNFLNNFLSNFHRFFRLPFARGGLQATAGKNASFCTS